jgi:hypothetical protein
MTKTDMITIIYQHVMKLNRFAGTQLNPVFASLCKSQVKKIFSKRLRELRNGFLWIIYGLFQSSRIFQRKITTSLSKMQKPFLYLFLKLFFLKNKAIFSVCILLNRHDICLLSINTQSLTL